MQEIVANLHIHTRYSDGTALHKQIIQDAIQANLDCLIFTDHNIRVEGIEGYHSADRKKLLVISGEEVHDQSRQLQKNHLLVFGHKRELAEFSHTPQTLIHRAREANALTFLAHPTDPALPLFHEGDISWEDWSVRDFHGLELWNGFAELKFRVTSKAQALLYAFYPDMYPVAPHPKTVGIWDDLTKNGKQIVAIAGSDAHALAMSLGPIHRTVFPYTYHFRAINNHLLLEQPLSGGYAKDREAVLHAFRSGHLFIGNDIPASTKGFNFCAQSVNGDLMIGDSGRIERSATLQIRLPAPSPCKLFKDGAVYREFEPGEQFTLIVKEPGVYRVEAYRNYLGRLRTWIISNPIYLYCESAKDDEIKWSQTSFPTL